MLGVVGFPAPAERNVALPRRGDRDIHLLGPLKGLLHPSLAVENIEAVDASPYI